MERSLLAWLAVGLLTAGAFPPSLAGAQEGAEPAVEAEPAPPTVIAYVDSGINPYHEEFRAPNLTDPSELVPGYPSDAEPLNLTLDADSFQEAWSQDEAAWEQQAKGQLYYIPGTKIVGTIWFYGGEYGAYEHTFDKDGHGTMVASIGSGNTLGTAPDSLVVAVQAGNHWEGLGWVANQEWIDIVSLSFGDHGQVGVPPAWVPSVGPLPAERVGHTAEQTHAITSSGRSAIAAGGNGGGATTISSSVAGPPWMLTVGPFSENHGRQFCTACERPFELALRDIREVAETRTQTDTRQGGGTSSSTPALAGYEAQLLRLARDRLNDTDGYSDGVYASAEPGTRLPDSGPLADGELNRTEVETVIRRSAQPKPSFRTALGTQAVPQQVAYLDQGYGLYDAATHETAQRVMLGQEPMPERPWADRWHGWTDHVRGTYWYTWLCQAEHRVPTPSECEHLSASALTSKTLASAPTVGTGEDARSLVEGQVIEQMLDPRPWGDHPWPGRS